jgi:iron complex transport system ATP-binding protein
MLQCEHVTVRYGGNAVVDDLSFRLDEGQWLMLVGPNGAGKTTLIEAIAQGVSCAGRLLWNGRELRSLKPAQLARKIGVLSQKNNVAYAYTVEEVVTLGRYAYQSGFFSGSDARQKEQVENALEMTGLTALRHASMLTLSGGETQRVFLAQVFAQDPQVLILDEPANHLDLNYQQQIFSLIQAWLKQPGRAVLSVVHDLSLARLFGTHAILMDHGKSLSQGTVEEVMTPSILRRVYGMDVYAWMKEMLSLWSSQNSPTEGV